MSISRNSYIFPKGPNVPLSVISAIIIAFVLLAAVVSWNRLQTVSAKDTVVVPQTPTLNGDSYGKLPLSLEPNRGQAQVTTKFLSRGAGYQLSLTANEAILRLRQRSQSEAPTRRADPVKPARPTRTERGTPPRMIELGMKFVGANPAPVIEAERELPGTSNYFVGNNSAQWRSDVPTYAQARYREIYPGIDLLFYGNQRQLEYDFIVSPGSATDVIRLAFRGAEKLEIDARGDLVLYLPGGGEVRQPKPVLYQEAAGGRREITGGYILRGKNQIGFRVGDYDSKLPLVIDPVLVYSTYLDVYATAQNGGVVVDAANNVYLTGANDEDVYVAKLNAAGTAFIYTTYVGGSGSGGWGDVGHGIAIDSAGNAYVSGDAYSLDFPVVNAFQSVKSSESINIPDVFVFKLDPAGANLIFSTYLGGEDSDDNYGIALDAAGNAFVTGYTESPIHYINAPPGAPFPTVNAYQPELAGAIDAFVTKLSPTGAVLFSTYLGGTNVDYALDVAVDSDGAPYLTGATDSTDYPTQNPMQPTLRGGGDVFITKLNPTGSALLYSTFLGGSGEDLALGLALDPGRNIYLTGYTYSADYPTQSPLQPAKAGGADAFVTKVNAAGSGLIYSTYVGGLGGEQGSDIALHPDGSVHVAGYSSSTNFPLVNPIQPTNAGGVDAILFKLNSTGSALIYSTYLGGGSGTFGGGDYGQGVALDSSGNAIFMGTTYASNFPTVNPIGTSGVFESAFLVKVSESGTQTIYRISGRFESNVGNPLNGVTVTLSGSQSATMVADGSLYSFTGLAAGGTYTVTPTRTGITFDPPSQTFTNLSSDQTADFMQAPRSYHITGRVTDTQGNGVPSVIVDIGGYYYPIQRYTDSEGNFVLMYLEAGRSYTVTPRPDTYSFAPRTYSFPNLNSSQTANFTALSNANLSISITNPANGATFQQGATINVSADATSTGSPINRVEFFANSNPIGTDTTAPYSIDWINLPGGAYGLSAFVTDEAGATRQSAATSIIVNSTQGPAVQITSPADNTTLLSGNYFTLSADASSPNGPITRVEFYEGAELIGTDTIGSPYTFSYYLYQGSYVLSAVAYDSTNAVRSSAPVHITVRTNQFPTVFVPIPEGGPSFPVGANITVTANASDLDGNVTEVKFYTNSTLIGTDTNAPYSAAWNNVQLGSYTVVASALDNEGGLSYSNYRDIRVGNSGPSVVLTSPSSFSQYEAPASIPITASAFDSDGTITQVEFFADGNVVGIDTTEPFSFTWNNVPAGDYDLVVRATDNSGATATSTHILARVFANLPQVSITTPAQGAHYEAPASIVLQVSASSPSGITSVWYYANGQNIGIMNVGPNFSMTWSGVVAGTYTLTAEAWDQNQAVGHSAPVTITVSGASWELQAPRFSGLNSETLEDVSMISPLEGWAVGDQGIIVRTTNGGASWTRQTSNTTDPLNAVSFADAQHGVIVGNTSLYTVNGGQTWLGGSGPGGSMYSVDMIDANTAWACGGGGVIYKTVDGGQTWFTQSTPIVGFDNLVGIDFVDANHGWAVGQDGTIIATTNGGTTWTLQNANTSSYFSAVSFVSPQEGWVVAGNLFLHTTNGGQTWIQQTVPANTWAYNVHFTDTNNGWASGSQENIVHTNNGGQTWTTQRPATFNSPLWGLSFSDALHGVTVGHGGTTLNTADGGQTWTRGAQSHNPEAVNRVVATDLNHAWTANNNGEVMYTTNGGATWSDVDLTPPTTSDVVGIDFSDNINGWAALKSPNSGQSYVYRSTNGGQAWQLSTTALPSYRLSDIAALDAQTAIAVGSGSNFLALVRRTTDGGQTWTSMPVPADANPLYAVEFINATTGWACGPNNTMIKTIDGGQTWTSQTVVADYLYDISFSDANNGWAVGAYDYVHTTNGGQTWQSFNTQGSINLKGVHTVNASTAWMVGDGYVGRTLNGGQTWTGESVGTFRYLRAAYFLDADNGWVGASWSTGEIYKRTGAANPNAPTVTITEPTNGASFPAGSNQTIRATASSPVGAAITSVDFYVNSQLLGTDISAPYEVSWNNISANFYTLTAVVTDSAGAQGTSAPITVTSQMPVEPTVFITNPANGATFPANANIALGAYASPANSSRFITRVDFYEGTNLIGTDASAPYGANWNGVAAASYTLTARAFDNLGAQAQSEPVNITVGGSGNTPPSVSLTSPTSGAVFEAHADIPVSADASDVDGTIAKVDFFAGAIFIGTDTTAPYSVQWPDVGSGTYNVTARATDDDGDIAVSSPVTITVNGGPPVGLGIVGRVVSPTGRLLPNITITLNGALSRTTTTDANGDYAFANLPAGGNYTVTPSFDQGSYIFNPADQGVVNLQTPQACNFVGFNLNGDEGDTGAFVISEFRFSGPGGPLDEFIEIYNTTARNITVQTADSSAGWALVSSDDVVRFVIPSGTVIPAHGHLLATNSAYSLSAYALGDINYTTDIPDSGGIALFMTANPSAFTPAMRFDAFGFGAVTNALYREGFSLAVAAEVHDENVSYVRKMTTGVPQDTNENGSDFELLASSRILGAPGPENLLSLIMNNGGFKPSLIDTLVSSAAAPNRVRDLAAVINGQLGTLSIRRRFTNRTGHPITRLRLRVIDITTQGTPNTCGGCAIADLRVLTSGDTNVTLTNGTTITVRGTLLEQAQLQPNGGGLNSALSIPVPGGVLVPNAAVNVQFLLGVQRGGTFRFFVNVEALP